MNKFNELGMNALAYKEEFLKDYPEIVHNSIALAIDNSTYSTEVKELLKNKDVSYVEFKDKLKSETSCLKTYQELLADFEVFRLKLNDVLLKDTDLDNVKTFSEVENDCLQVVQEYIITETFIRDYFDISDDKEFEKLMSRKGFIEKFAILRLNRIFKDFLSNIKTNLNVHQTSVFFSSEKNVYGILLEFLLPIDEIDEHEDFSEIGAEIISICKDANTNFNKRMLI